MHQSVSDVANGLGASEVCRIGNTVLMDPSFGASIWESLLLKCWQDELIPLAIVQYCPTLTQRRCWLHSQPEQDRQGWKIQQWVKLGTLPCCEHAYSWVFLYIPIHILIGLPVRCATTKKTKPTSLFITAEMEITFPFLRAQTPCINVYSPSLKDSRHSRNIKYNDEKHEHAEAAFIRMIYPAILDLEENVLDETDWRLWLEFGRVGCDFR